MLKKMLYFLIVVILICIFLNYKDIIRKYFFVNKYESTVVKYAKQYNLEPELVFSIIKAESNFNENANSNKGAIGLMQITPSTGKYISKLLKHDNYSSKDLYGIDINIRFGCFYMSKLLNDFNNDVNSALAAYNGGEGNVRKWIKRNNRKKMPLRTSDISFNETKNYVVKVNRYLKAYKQLYKYSNNND